MKQGAKKNNYLMELNVKQSGIERRTFTAIFQKNRNGKVYKRIHELYLRNDIPCGLNVCERCKHVDQKPLLILNNENFSSIISFKHFLILDSLTILKFVDVLEENIFRNIIIPQSAWNYVKSTNPSVYKRMNTLYLENRDRFFVFLNQFVSETFVDSGLNKVPELYQEKCVLKLVFYLENHWKNFEVNPVVICSSEEVKERLLKIISNVFTLYEYTKGINGCSKIAERLADLSRDKSKGKVLYNEHLSQDQLLDGLAKGTLKKGKFQISTDNYMEGYVTFDHAVQWFIQGQKNMNRAIQGDVVVAELLPKHEWSFPEKTIRLRDAEELMAKEGIVDNEGEEDAEVVENDPYEEIAAKRSRNDTVSSFIPTAKIVGILKRNWRNYCGVILPPNIKGGRRYLFSPSERLIPRIRIETSHYENLQGKKILVQIDSWPQDSYYPKGHYIKIIGNEGDRDTENEVILLEHEIPHADFSPAVLACLPIDTEKNPWKPELSSYRVDLTHIDICSVDPEGCTDIDDALHCIDLGDGLFEVGVHIADVTHFVRPGSPLDIEAAKRSTTVYLCDRRIDMLPDVLSSNLCSLQENKLRYAFSVIWILKETNDSSINIENVKFLKSLIKSRVALTYQKAQNIIDDTMECTDNISNSLRHLLRLSKYLKSKRKIMGALELASPEIKFDINYETNELQGVMEKKYLPTMSMIEEFMLLANISVAEKTLEAFPDCAILRRHPIPSKDSFKPIIEMAKSCGYQLNVDTGKELSKSLDEIIRISKSEKNTKKSLTGQMLRMLTTRCMTQAIYFSSGTLAADHYLHYGLAAKVYTHFTSPIRRYADIMVHRLLATLIGVDKIHPMMVDRHKLIRQTENMNKRHRQAQYAGRSSILLHTFLMIKQEKIEILDAIVIGILKNAIQIQVSKYNLETVIFINDGLINLDKKISLFDKIRVSLNLEEKNQRRRIKAQLIEPEIEGIGVVIGCESDTI